MTNGTKRKIVCSTVKEAEFFAENDFDDILFGSLIVKERISKCVNISYDFVSALYAI